MKCDPLTDPSCAQYHPFQPPPELPHTGTNLDPWIAAGVTLILIGLLVWYLVAKRGWWGGHW